MQRSPLYYLSRDKQTAVARAMVFSQFLPKVLVPTLRLRATAEVSRKALGGRLMVQAREAATAAAQVS